MEQFAHLAQEHNYYMVIDCLDGSDALTHVFDIHPQSGDLLCAYPNMIPMDSTYNSNKYALPMLEIVGVTLTNHNFWIRFVVMCDETKASYAWALLRLKM